MLELIAARARDRTCRCTRAREASSSTCASRNSSNGVRGVHAVLRPRRDKNDVTVAYEFQASRSRRGIDGGRDCPLARLRGTGDRGRRPARRDPNRQDDGRDPVACPQGTVTNILVEEGKVVPVGDRARRHRRATPMGSSRAPQRRLGRHPSAPAKGRVNPPRAQDRAGARRRPRLAHRQRARRGRITEGGRCAGRLGPRRGQARARCAA